MARNCRRHIKHRPSKSLQHLSAKTGVSSEPCQVTWKMKLQACCVAVVQEFKSLDDAYCRRFQQRKELGLKIFERTFVIDETQFHLRGSVNSQNARNLKMKNPSLLQDVTRRSQKKKSQSPFSSITAVHHTDSRQDTH